MSILSWFAIPQIFREVRQTHQDNRQPHNVRDINPSRKHSGNDNRNKKADDGPDKEHLKLIQFITLLTVDFTNRIVIIWTALNRQYQVFLKNLEKLAMHLKNANLSFFVLKYGALFVNYSFSRIAVSESYLNSDFRILAAP